MDPSPALKAGLSLYEAGGLALVLLALMAILVWLVGRFLFRLIEDMGKRLNDLEDRQVNKLDHTIAGNTQALQQLVSATAEQTDSVKTQTEVLRQRPCLIESGVHPRPILPRG